MYRRLEPWAFPRNGVSAHVVRKTRRVFRHHETAKPSRTTPSAVGGLHAQPRTHGEVLSRSSVDRDGLAHAALIRGEPRARHLGSEQGISHPPRGGQYRVYPASPGRFGPSLLSPMGAASVDGSRVWGRITSARANGPVWTGRTTTIETPTASKRTDTETTVDQSAVVGEASDALPPTTNVVESRAVPR